MTAAVFTAAPKSGRAGMPPMTPGSAVSVMSRNPFFVGHAGDALGHADAQVDDAIDHQLERRRGAR